MLISIKIHHTWTIIVSILSGLNFSLYLDKLWAKPRAIAIISCLGSPPMRLSAWLRIHLISSWIAEFDRQFICNFSIQKLLFFLSYSYSTKQHQLPLIAEPSLASATAKASWASSAKRDFNVLRRVFESLPSMAAVVADKASVVSVNFLKCFNLTLEKTRIISAQKKSSKVVTYTLLAPSGVWKSWKRLSVCWSFFSSNNCKQINLTKISNTSRLKTILPWIQHNLLEFQIRQAFFLNVV